MSKWENYFLDDLAYYYNGKAFKPSDWTSDGVKIIRIEQINNPNGDYDYYQGVFPDNNSIDNGDLIFSWSATLKVVIWKYGKGVLNQHLFKVIPKHFINKDYLYFLLDYNMPKLGDTSHGSTMKHIKRGELKKYNVAVPNYPIQQKIAKILSTIDGQIEKTEAIIAKYQAVKQGMLQDLFTRGIDVTTGALRPRYEDAPELYKDSPLGMIPREWEVDTFSRPFEIINGGTPATNKKEYWDGIIPWLSVEDFNHDERYVNHAIKHISKSGLKNSSTNLLRKDMIIISARGTVGVIAQLGTSMAFNQSCYGINSVDKRISNDFGYYFLSYYRTNFGFSSFGSVFSTITRNYFDTLHFSFPKNQIEMTEIVNRISIIDKLRKNERDNLYKQQMVKQGLMSDLLSGKVEVTA